MWQNFRPTFLQSGNVFVEPQLQTCSSILLVMALQSCLRMRQRTRLVPSHVSQLKKGQAMACLDSHTSSSTPALLIRASADIVCLKKTSLIPRPVQMGLGTRLIKNLITIYNKCRPQLSESSSKKHETCPKWVTLCHATVLRWYSIWRSQLLSNEDKPHLSQVFRRTGNECLSCLLLQAGDTKLEDCVRFCGLARTN